MPPIMALAMLPMPISMSTLNSIYGPYSYQTATATTIWAIVPSRPRAARKQWCDWQWRLNSHLAPHLAWCCRACLTLEWQSLSLDRTGWRPTRLLVSWFHCREVSYRAYSVVDLIDREGFALWRQLRQHNVVQTFEGGQPVKSVTSSPSILCHSMRTSCWLRWSPYQLLV